MIFSFVFIFIPNVCVSRQKVVWFCWIFFFKLYTNGNKIRILSPVVPPPQPASFAVIVFFCCVTAVLSGPLLLFILLCEHSTQDLVSWWGRCEISCLLSPFLPSAFPFSFLTPFFPVANYRDESLPLCTHESRKCPPTKDHKEHGSHGTAGHKKWTSSFFQDVTLGLGCAPQAHGVEAWYSVCDVGETWLWEIMP